MLKGYKWFISEENSYAVFVARANLRRSKGKMGHNYGVVKTLTLTTVGSYFAYALYWFVKTIPWVVEIS